METDILRALAEIHAEIGFPQPEQISVVSRENTGNGRCTRIWSEKALDLTGPVEAPLLIKASPVRYGMAALVFLQEGRPSFLEIVVDGEDFWSGDEAGYSVSSY